MSRIEFEIDGIPVTADPGATVLEAAQAAGIEIPTLCHHEKLEPFGACRLCIVEVEERGWTKLVVSCVFPAKAGIQVRTRSEKVDRIRKTIIELLMAHAPDAPQLVAYAKEYGADPHRFEPESDFCIHCGLCVRYCNEVAGKYALGFVDRGIRKEISFIPAIAAKECNDCKECFPLCPTSYLQAAFVLTQAMAFPDQGRFLKDGAQAVPAGEGK
ncbi:MAG: 2Fe-2S iron-sulfur cluster-binding protein [Desulfobacterales bacterium]|nr:2Fe-2S iron-sulfur cluster-binding protein [Desulfobacterales bacterium]